MSALSMAQTVRRVGPLRAPVARRAAGVVIAAPRAAAPKAVSLGFGRSVGGLSLAPRAVTPVQRTRGSLVVVAGGLSLGCTKGGTKRKRANTSGFRARMATPAGRAVLKRRRKKGRKNLCPASHGKKK